MRRRKNAVGMNTDASPSVLARLRALAPSRALRVYEALRVAELQAAELLELSGVEETPVPNEVITRLPRVRVDYDFDMPDSASGASLWDDSQKAWIVTINARQTALRQRFTLLHEYKHIIDHGRAPIAASASARYFGQTPREYVADYFAGCVLMPRQLVKRAWGRGIQSVVGLAQIFDVSEQAMRVRLLQLRLSPSTPRCRNDGQLSLCSGAN